MDPKLKSAYEMLASGYSALAEYFSSQVEDAASLPTKVSSPKPKKAKDPSAPKKPPTNFLLFANEMRAKLKEQYPEKTHMELTKELGNLWKSVDHSKYDEQAKLLTQGYLNDMNEYKKRNLEEHAPQASQQSPASVETPKKKKKEIILESSPLKQETEAKSQTTAMTQTQTPAKKETGEKKEKSADGKVAPAATEAVVSNTQESPKKKKKKSHDIPTEPSDSQPKKVKKRSHKPESENKE